MTGYAEAYAEVIDIMEHMDKTLVSKIPPQMIALLTKNASKKYKVELDYTKSLKEMDLNQKTSAVLTLIFINYLCAPEKKEEYINRLNENEKKYQEELNKKYSYENLFCSKESIEKDFKPEEIPEVDDSNTKMIEYKEKNILDKIFEKIKQLLKWKK